MVRVVSIWMELQKHTAKSPLAAVRAFFISIFYAHTW